MSTSARYWREIPQRYRYEAAKCKGCGAVHFPPRLICRHVQGRSSKTWSLPTTGKVETFTVIRVAPSEYTDEAPYADGHRRARRRRGIQCQIADCDPRTSRPACP